MMADTARAISGSGTDGDPYLIGSVEDWNALADKVANGESSIHARLTANLNDVTTMVGTPSNAFSGTFDGDGYTITIRLNSTEADTGLFRYVGSATFKNLHVAGTIQSNQRRSGPLIGKANKGTLNIENICSSVDITQTQTGEITAGGLIGYRSDNESKTTITDCLFNGSITATNGGIMVGGIVGCSEGLVTMNRVIQAGTFNGLGTSRYDAIFVRDFDLNMMTTDCYYVNTVGGATSISSSKATQITAEELNTQTYIDLLQTDKQTTYWGLRAGKLTWVSQIVPMVTFKFDGKTVFTLFADEVGGTVSVPTAEAMLSTYYIQDATFTYDDAPFTSATTINEDIEVTISGTLLVGSIAISAADNTLAIGETTTVSVAITPSFAGYALTSSNPAVAMVAQDGTVAYVSSGTATITATADADHSKTALVVINCSEMVGITIGDDATLDDFYNPYSNYRRYSTTQQIYRPAEMGNKAGTIRSIAFKVQTKDDYETSSVKIYLGHKSHPTFASELDFVSNGLTLVYDGAPILGQAMGWEKLEFNQKGRGFEYNGTDNLVVVVCKTAPFFTSVLTYYFRTVERAAMYRFNNYDALFADVADTDKPYTIFSRRPSVKFWVEYDECEIEEGVAYTRTTDRYVAKATYTRSFGSDRVGKYQAWFLPFDYTITSSDVEKFDFFRINCVASAEEEGEDPENDNVYVYLAPIGAGTTLQGNTPYVYRPKDIVTDYQFVSENTTLLAKDLSARLSTATANATYDFYGTYDNTTATAEAPFYYISIYGNISRGTSVTVGPYRWLMRATDNSGISYAPRLSFVEDDADATGIHTVQDISVKNQGCYNLAGQRVALPSKGLYISKGHKVVVK